MIRFAILLLALCGSVSAQEFGGLKIGGSSDLVATFPGQPILGQTGRDRYAKFQRPDGHSLSITTRDFGPIIYMESNRNHAIPPVAGAGVHFGYTTLGAVRSLIGQDGFRYDSRGTVVLGNADTVHFLSYELANEAGVVVTFAFLLPASQAALGPDAALLDGVILGTLTYLDEIWGPGKTVSPNYAPITFTY